MQLLHERQQHTLHRDNPVRLWALIEETVLARPVGSAETMREQLRHLNQFAENRGTVTVQIIPAAAGPHPLLLGGPADVLRYTQCALDDRLVVRGLHAEAATLTDDLDVVRTYQAPWTSPRPSPPPPPPASPHPEGIPHEQRRPHHRPGPPARQAPQRAILELPARREGQPCGGPGPR
ncbi:Scr1 family TA system antitoxin-like transcriptional regulator [Streptomyces microflavus]|uniref:Scr1 family TA system antitoxin-like transcriptional regulator n=1 Tax=Streptomyces microflavus TaxID=1919 RepID=UPI0033C90FEC